MGSQQIGLGPRGQARLDDRGRGPLGRFWEFLERRRGAPTSFVRIPLPTRGRLYVSPMPFGPYDVRGRILKEYTKAGVSIVFTLVTDQEIAKKARRDILQLYAERGIRVYRLPFQDLTAPVADEFDRFAPVLLYHLQDSHLAIHCNAGVGRTGVAAACLVARAYGIDGRQAIEHVRLQMMTDMTDEQQRFVASFAERKTP